MSRPQSASSHRLYLRPSSSQQLTSQRQRKSIIKKVDMNIQRLTKKKLQVNNQIKDLQNFKQNRNQMAYLNAIKDYTKNTELIFRHETNRDTIHMMRTNSRPKSARTKVQISRVQQKIVQNQGPVFKYNQDTCIKLRIAEMKKIRSSLQKQLKSSKQYIELLENGYKPVKNVRRKSMKKAKNPTDVSEDILI